MKRTSPAIKSRGSSAAASTILPRQTQPPIIEVVYVLPLRGWPRTLGDPAGAIAFIDSYDESKPHTPFTRYEVGVRYSNGDEIRGQFEDKATAITFLRGIK